MPDKHGKKRAHNEDGSSTSTPPAPSPAPEAKKTAILPALRKAGPLRPFDPTLLSCPQNYTGALDGAKRINRGPVRRCAQDQFPATADAWVFECDLCEQYSALPAASPLSSARLACGCKPCVEAPEGGKWYINPRLRTVCRPTSRRYLYQAGVKTNLTPEAIQFCLELQRQEYLAGNVGNVVLISTTTEGPIWHHQEVVEMSETDFINMERLPQTGHSDVCALVGIDVDLGRTAIERSLIKIPERQEQLRRVHAFGILPTRYRYPVHAPDSATAFGTKIVHPGHEVAASLCGESYDKMVAGEVPRRDIIITVDAASMRRYYAMTGFRLHLAGKPITGDFAAVLFTEPPKKECPDGTFRTRWRNMAYVEPASYTDKSVVLNVAKNIARAHELPLEEVVISSIQATGVPKVPHDDRVSVKPRVFLKDLITEQRRLSLRQDPSNKGVPRGFAALLIVLPKGQKPKPGGLAQLIELELDEAESIYYLDPREELLFNAKGEPVPRPNIVSQVYREVTKPGW